MTPALTVAGFSVRRPDHIAIIIVVLAMSAAVMHFPLPEKKSSEVVLIWVLYCMVLEWNCRELNRCRFFQEAHVFRVDARDRGAGGPRAHSLTRVSNKKSQGGEEGVTTTCFSAIGK